MPRVRRNALLFASALVAPVAACSSVLGIQDRSLDTQGDDAATSDVTVDGMSHVDGGSDSPATDGPGTDSGTTDSPACANPCPVITPINRPEGIATDSKNIYWTELGDNFMTSNGAVKGCPLAGCGSGPIVYANGLANPASIVSDGQTIYWGDYTGGGVFACAVTGCAMSPRLVANANNPWGLAIDATYIYWVDQSNNTLHRAIRTGGADAAAASDNLLWDAGPPGMSFNSNYVAVDDASAYLIDDNSNLFKIPLAGGSALLLFSGGGGGSGANWNVVLEPSGLLFGDVNGQVLRASTTTPGAATPLVSMLQDPEAVGFDPATGDIYWADLGGGSGTDGIIGRAHSDGSMKTNLATSQQSPIAVAIQGGSVFWANHGTWDATNMVYMPNTGAIYSAPK